jgi:ribosomal-protein-alanine N-acetyltransferase
MAINHDHPARPRWRRPAGAVEAGRRAYLRYPAATDEDEFVVLMRASRRLHYPWVRSIDGDAFQQYMSRSQRPDVEALLVCRNGTDEIAGFLNLTQIHYGAFCSAMCGYAAFAPSAAQGYLGEGLSLMLRHAFATLRLHRLEANIQPGNDRSRALAERSGFRLEGFSPRFLKIGGRWRDHERWAITVEDWRHGRRPR